MSRFFKFIFGLTGLVVLLLGGLVGYRSLMLYEGRTPEGYAILTAIADAASFEPKLPAAPVLQNQASDSIAVNFGYQVGSIPYSYSLTLTFPAGSETGRATVKVRHAAREASVETNAVRRWDEPRKAYSVALQDKFDIVQPPVPSLCIKAVIGPDAKSYDLKDASICVAQRDGIGNCHAETLACGLIR